VLSRQQRKSDPLISSRSNYSSLVKSLNLGFKSFPWIILRSLNGEAKINHASRVENLLNKSTRNSVYFLISSTCYPSSNTRMFSDFTLLAGGFGCIRLNIGLPILATSVGVVFSVNCTLADVFSALSNLITGI